MEKALQTVTQDSADKRIEKRQNNVVKKRAAGLIYLYNLLQFIPFK